MNWFTVIAQILNFIILVLLLKKFLYGPVIRAMDTRQQRIDERLQEAADRRREAEEERQEYQRRNQEWEQEQQQLREEARDAVETEREERLRHVREEVEKRRQTWEDALREEQQSFAQDARARLAGVVTDLARRALADLADAELEERLVERFLDRVHALDDKEREELQRSAREHDDQVTVTTAFPVADSLQRKMTQRLQNELGGPVKVTYSVDESVLAGVEMRVDGRKLSWSLAQYVSTIDEAVHDILSSAAAEGGKSERDEHGGSAADSESNG